MKRAHNRIDLTGQRFGRLMVIEYAETREDKRARWSCICDCGANTIIAGAALRLGTRSCGCITRERTVERNFRHGLRRSRFYGIWLQMKQRCYNKKNKEFMNYGGKGIEVCGEWLNDSASFIKWCEATSKPRGKILLDRRDNALGYSPTNCRFVTDADSVRNRSMSVWVEIGGERLVLKDAVAKYGMVSYGCAKVRVRERGWDPRDAVITPYVRPRKSHCVRGHALSGPNVYEWRGQRLCKQCRANRAAS